MAALTLRFETPETARWSDGDTPVGDVIRLDAAGSKLLAIGTRDFLALFEDHGRRPLVELEMLRAHGQAIASAWVAPALAHVKPIIEAPGPHSWVIRSDDPAMLDLAWELVEFTPGLPVGCDPAWSVSRASIGLASSNGHPLRPGPLRVLFLAAAPTDQVQLDYQLEEDLMLRASTDVKGTIITHFAETGGIDELAELVDECRPHVVHLSGHGDVDAQGRGVFCFEDERGRTDLIPVDELAERVFRGKGVGLAFVNGCKTSQAAVAGLCRGLVAAGVPAALGWAASVADDRATEFAAEFYRRLVRNDPAPIAAAHARDKIRRSGRHIFGNEERQDATFALPRLYGNGADATLFDRTKHETYDGPRTVYALLGDGIKGLKSGYVGRRREVQRLVPAFRQGEVTYAVLTGIGGTGKSTLATRAVNRLQAVGFGVIALKIAARPTPAESARDAASRLLAALDDAFLKANRQDMHALLTNGDLPTGQRLRLAVDGLNDLKLVLALDNFEDALDLETRRVAHPDLAEFMDALARNLTRGSRAIVTCRYLPEPTPIDLPNVLHLPLNELPAYDALKFFRRDAKVDDRIARGELARHLIDRIYAALGGTPGLLGQVRTLLQKADPDELLEELEGGEPGMLAEHRNAYCAEILTTRLYVALSEPARKLTSRLALSLLPIPAEAAAPLVDLPEAAALAPLEEAVAYGLLQRFDDPDYPALYHPPGLLRSWLADPARLATDGARPVHAHLAAFWRASYEADREDELRVDFGAELDACRHHASQADDPANFAWATRMIATRLYGISEWNEAKSLLEAIPEEARDAPTLHLLATIDVNRGEYDAARAGFDAALEIRRDIGDRAGQAATLHQLATIDVYRGEYDAARAGLDAALEIQRAIGDRAGQAATLHSLATIDLRRGDYDAARAGLDAALEIQRAIGDRAGQAATLHQLATIDVYRGEYDAARDGFDAALEIKRAIGDRAGQATTLHNLASIDLNWGEYDAARAGFDAALEIQRAIGDRAGQAATLHQLATIDVYRGEYDAARDGFDAALEIRRDIGDRAGQAATLHSLASIDVYRGEYDAARAGLDAALEIQRAIGDRAGQAATLHQLATIDVYRGEYDAARDRFDAALEIKRAIGDRAGQATTLHNLASIDLNWGEYDAARAGFDAALEIQRAIGDRAGQAATLHQLASIDLNRGEYDAARAGFDAALETRRAIGDRAGQAATLHSLATIDLNRGEYDAARDGLDAALEIQRAIGDRAGQAATLHQLASIDLNRGEYDAARAGFDAAPEILSAIGDRYGEAATFFQLGDLALTMGRGHHAARLQAVCFLIDQSIGHGDAEADFRALSGVCSDLGYDQARFDRLLAEVVEAYRADGGRGLIERAFAADGTDEPPKPPGKKKSGLFGWLRRLRP